MGAQIGFRVDSLAWTVFIELTYLQKCEPNDVYDISKPRIPHNQRLAGLDRLE